MYLAAYELTQVPLPYMIAYYTSLPLHCCLLYTDSAYCIHFMYSLLLTNVKHIAHHCIVHIGWQLLCRVHSIPTPAWSSELLIF